MEITNIQPFPIQELPKGIRRHIFVVAYPSIQNQLKNSCKSWHKIGAKQAPSMYKLINDESFHPSHDDWRYIMMHAALDKNSIVMNNILNRTEQRNFDYDFGLDYFGENYNKQKSFRLCDVYSFATLSNNNWEKVAYEKCKELDLGSNLDTCKVNFKASLFKACFDGDIYEVQRVLNEKNKAGIVCDCIVISVHNDNPYCIKELSPFVKHIRFHEAHLNLLLMAMKKQKKRAFTALVEHAVYSEVYSCAYEHPDIPNAFEMHAATLKELYEQTEIPNLEEYIALYKELTDQIVYKKKIRADSSSSNSCSIQ